MDKQTCKNNNPDLNYTNICKFIHLLNDEICRVWEYGVGQTWLVNTVESISTCINKPCHEVNSPLSDMMTLFLGEPLSLPSASILYNTSIPESTLPKTTWRPSSLPRNNWRNEFVEKGPNSSHKNLKSYLFISGSFFLDINV